MRSKQQHETSITRDAAYKLVCECIKQRNLKGGRHATSLIIQNGLDTVAVLADHLIRLFAVCGDLVEANNAFNRVVKPSQYTWSAIIDAHARFGKGQLALHIYNRMQHEGIKPDRVILLSILRACSSIGITEYGREIHQQIIESGFQSQVVLINTLVDTYCKCGSLMEAYSIFHTLLNPDIVSWSALIVGSAQHGESRLALKYYNAMLHDGKEVGKVAFLGVLRACGGLPAVEHGRCAHEKIIESKLQTDIDVGNTLIDMYVKCGRFEEAFKVLYTLPYWDVVSWNAIIAGYVHVNEGHSALECSRKMQNEGIKPNKFALSSILKACGNVGAIDWGRHIHEQIIGFELQSNNLLGNTLIDMYAKCGSIMEAHQVFKMLSSRDVMSWGSIITAYAQLGGIGVAMHFFNSMRNSGIRPDVIAYSGVLTAFSRAGLVDESRWYFRFMRKYDGIKPDTYHVTCMVDLLGCKGYFCEAEDLLKDTIQADSSACFALLGACRLHCNVGLGRRCFDAIVHVDPHYAPAYTLISNIYADARRTDKT